MLEYVADVAPTPLPAANPVLFWGWTVVLVAWCFFAIGVGRLVKLYRRDSIVGPERIGHTESGWVLVGILCLGGAVGMYGGMVVSRLIGSRIGEQDRRVVTGAAVYGVAFAALLGASVYARGTDWPRIGLRWRGFGIGLLAGAIALVMIDPFVQLTLAAVSEVFAGLHKTPPTHEVLKLMGRSDTPAWVFWASGLSACVIAPLAEELIFRGFLQTALARGFAVLSDLKNRTATVATTATGSAPRWAAVVVTSVLFAAAHGELAFFVPLFVLSVGLGYLYERTGNLWATITVHSLFNLSSSLIFLHSSG